MRTSRNTPIGRLLALSILLLLPNVAQAKGGPCDPLTGFCQYICGIDTLFLNFDANPGHVSYDIFIDGVQFFDDELVTAPATEMVVVNPPEGVVVIDIVTTCADGSTMNNFCVMAIAPPVAPPGTDLIIVKEGTTTGSPGSVDSSTALENSLLALGREPVRRAYNDFTNFVNEGCLDLMEWDVVWVMGGTLPDGDVLTTTEGNLLAARVAAGLPTYLESADHWAQAPPSDLDMFDGVDGTFSTQIGVGVNVDIAFPVLNGLTLWNGEPTQMIELPDLIDPLASPDVTTSAIPLGIFSEPLYSTALEFGGFFSFEQIFVAHAILDRFGEIGCSVVTDVVAQPSAPNTLIFWQSLFGSSELQFSFTPAIPNPPSPVSSVQGSIVVPTLDVSPLGETIVNLLPGQSYAVTLTQTCNTPGATPDPIQLTVEMPCYGLLGGDAQLVPGGVELSVNGQADLYPLIRFVENGALVGTLLPGETSIIVPATAGPHDYELQYSCDGLEFFPAPGASIVVPCTPISNVTCTNAGSAVDLSWSNGVVYSEIQVQRNGSLIATLAGSDSTFTDLNASAGTNNYALTGICDAVQTQPAGCTIEVGTQYIRGDCNVDSATDVGDAIAALAVLFSGGTTSCVDACNVNGDAAFDIADAIYLLGYLFSGGAEPPAPFPECGFAEQLGCDTGPSCVDR